MAIVYKREFVQFPEPVAPILAPGLIPPFTGHEPGATVVRSGIYRCSGCGREAAVNAGDPFPPQNCNQHPDQTEPIRWFLIVGTSNDHPRDGQ